MREKQRQWRLESHWELQVRMDSTNNQGYADEYLGVLGELICCEVSGWADENTRRIGFRVVTDILLLMLTIVLPAMQIQSVLGESKIAKMGWKWQVGLVVSVMTTWLWTFWVLVGKALPDDVRGTLKEEFLARVGVIGVTV